MFLIEGKFSQTEKKNTQAKSEQENMESVLCWPNSSVWGLHLQKTDYPYPSRHQQQIASRLGVGHCVHFVFSVLGSYLVWTCAGLEHAVSLCKLIYGAVLFLGVIYHLYSYNFWPIFHIDPCVLRMGREVKGGWERISFRTQCSEVSRYLPTVQLWISFLIFIYCKKQLL